MKGLKDRLKKQRIGLWLAAVLLAVAVLTEGFACRGRSTEWAACSDSIPRLYAWWGTMYPEFCFQEYGEKGADSSEKEPQVKISFWLAKAFDW